MKGDFENDLDWFTLGTAFSIWAAHFMISWSISSIFPGERIVLWLTLALTVAALAGLVWLWRRQKVATVISIPGLAVAFAFVGVVYALLPSLMA